MKNNIENKFFKRAFTLAEVLVVIAIIGVVSALTIPNLVSDTTAQETVTRILKTRATIDEAYRIAMVNHGDPCTWSLNASNATAQSAVWYNNIVENLKIDTDCGLVASNNTVCWKSKSSEDNSYYKMLLKDGTALAMTTNTQAIATGYGCGDTYAFSVLVDVDGPRKGNGDVCDDIYELGYNATGYVFVGSASGNLTKTSMACTAWILKNKNADFLKSEYNDGTTASKKYFKCSDTGKILNWSTNKLCK